MEPHCNWFTSKYDDVEDLLVSISNCDFRNRIGNVGLQQHNMPDYAQAPKYAATNSPQHPHLSGSRTSHCDGAVRQLTVQGSVSLRARLGVNLRATVQCSKVCPTNSSPFPPRGREAIRQGRGGKPCVFQLHTHRSATTTGSQPTFLCVDPPSDQAPPGSLSFLVVLYIYCIDDRMSRYLLPTLITDQYIQCTKI